jgi:hypothetical protein
MVVPGIEAGTSGSVARNSDHYGGQYVFSQSRLSLFVWEMIGCHFCTCKFNFVFQIFLSGEFAGNRTYLVEAGIISCYAYKYTWIRIIIFQCYFNSKFYCSFHKNSSWFSILGKINPVHILTIYFYLLRCLGLPDDSFSLSDSTARDGTMVSE